MKFRTSTLKSTQIVLRNITDMIHPVEYHPIANKLGVGSRRFLLFRNCVNPKTPPIPKLGFLIKCHPPTLSEKHCTSPQNERSFTVSYLEETCGFSPETASSLAERVKFKTSENADSVRTFLRNFGFSNSQIRDIVRRVPEILRYDPVKSISPKFEFLQSLGFSNSELAEAVTSSPYLLCRSLENHIIPTFEVIKNLFRSDEKAVLLIKEWPCLISFYNVRGNIQVLLDSGVPDMYVCKLIERRPLVFLEKSRTFTEGVEKLKKLGFNPSRSNFGTAFIAVSNMSREKWDRKIEIFTKWGWTKDDFFAAFRRCPNIMLISESKIMAVMDFLVNQMGCSSMLVARLPKVLEKSFEEVIVPRSRVVLYLYSKGLIKKNCSLVTPLTVAENVFVQHYIERFEEEAPLLMNLYGEN